MMLISLTTALLSLSTLSTALSNAKVLKARKGPIGPNEAYQIFSAEPERSQDLGASSNNNPGGNSTTLYGRRQLLARQNFNFHVSVGPNNSDREDLVVSFGNLPCPPASHGAYSFEFNYVPTPDYASAGENQINMFKINGDISAAPTFNEIEAKTGSLIGTFELPTGAEANSPRLIFINQLVCEPTINLRFGITQYSSQAGAVVYLQRDGMGLRERDGF